MREERIKTNNKREGGEDTRRMDLSAFPLISFCFSFYQEKKSIEPSKKVQCLQKPEASEFLYQTPCWVIGEEMLPRKRCLHSRARLHRCCLPALVLSDQRLGEKLGTSLLPCLTLICTLYPQTQQAGGPGFCYNTSPQARSQTATCSALGTGQDDISARIVFSHLSFQKQRQYKVIFAFL